MPLPLYGFVEGDTVGLLIVADERESVQSLAGKLRDAARLRVDADGEMELFYQGALLDPTTTLAQAGFRPLQRFDLRKKHGISDRRDTR